MRAVGAALACLLLVQTASRTRRARRSATPSAPNRRRVAEHRPRVNRVRGDHATAAQLAPQPQKPTQPRPVMRTALRWRRDLGLFAVDKGPDSPLIAAASAIVAASLIASLACLAGGILAGVWTTALVSSVTAAVAGVLLGEALRFTALLRAAAA